MSRKPSLWKRRAVGVPVPSSPGTLYGCGLCASPVGSGRCSSWRRCFDKQELANAAGAASRLVPRRRWMKKNARRPHFSFMGEHVTFLKGDGGRRHTIHRGHRGTKVEQPPVTNGSRKGLPSGVLSGHAFDRGSDYVILGRGTEAFSSMILIGDKTDEAEHTDRGRHKQGGLGSAISGIRADKAAP